MTLFKYTKYIIILLIIIVIVYFLRAPLFAPSIKKYLSSKVEKEIDFEKFYISPISLTFTNLKVKDTFLVKKISFDFRPIKLICNIKTPIKAIRKVKVSNVEIMLNKENSTIKGKSINKPLHIDSGSFNFDISVDEILLKNKYENVNFKNISLKFDKGDINFIAALDINGFIFDINSKLERKNEKEFNTLTTIISKNKIVADIIFDGTFDSDLNLYQNIKVTKLKYKGLNFRSFEGVISKNSDIVSLNISGASGNFNIESYLSLSKINKNVIGDVNSKIILKDNVEKINLSIKNLSIFNLGNGNFDFNITKNEKDNYIGCCIYGENKKVDLVVSKDGSYEKRIIVNGKELGSVIGNIKKGTIKTNIKNVRLLDLPLKDFLGKKVYGIINFYGQIDEVAGQIDFSLYDLSNNKKVIGTITRNNDIYVFNFSNVNETLLFNTVVEKGDILSSDFKFIKIDTFKLFDILGYDLDKFSGIATGRIKYQKNAFLEFNLKIFDGYLYGNNFKKFDVKGNINSNEFNVEHCKMVDYSDKELFDIRAILGFSKQIESFLVASIKNFKISFVNLTSYAEFKGFLDEKKVMNGLLKISSINFSGANLDDISAEIKMSNKEIKIYNLKSSQDIGATGLINFKENKVRVNLECKNLDIKGLYKRFSGFLTFLVDISGNLSNPEISFCASVTNGRYFTLPFSLFSEIKLKDKVLILDKVKLLSNKTNISLSGSYTNNGSIDVGVNNLDEKIINAFVGFRTPLNINFTGTGNIFIKDNKLDSKLFLHSKTAYIKNFKLNDVKCNFEIKNSNIYLSSASCNISDSQVKADKGFFNLKDKTYGLDLFLVNVRTGIFDFLGSINLLGRMVKDENSYKYTGSANLNNFWISKYKLDSLKLNYHIKNKTLELYQQHDDKKDALKISALAIFGDVLSIRKLNILRNDASFNLSTDISKDFINLSLASTNLESKILTDIFNLRDLVFGKSNINLNLLGDIKKPKGSLQIDSKNGFFIGAPYDNLNVMLNLENNRVYINKANIFKRNELQVSINGDFPFYLKRDLTDKQSSVNIFYEINDYKLNILKYMSLDFIRPFSGKMFLKGSFTGSLDKINSNAKLSISGASFELKEYLNKVKNMYVDITLVDNLLSIDNFNLKSGSGKLNVYGNIKLKNFNVDYFDIRFITTQKGIPIKIPQLPLTSFIGSKYFLKDYSFGEPSFDIKIEGNPTSLRISGKIILESTRFTYPGISENNKESIFPDSTYINLDFITTKNTRFENSYVSALINGALHLEGYPKNLKAEGIIDSSRGTIDYLGMSFNISNAKLEILNDKSIYLTLTCETSLPSKTGEPSDTIRLVVDRRELSGLSQPGSVKLVSKDNTNIDFQKILGLDTNQDASLEVSYILGQQIVHLLNQTAAIPFAKGMLRKTGLIDNFKVSYTDTKSLDINDTKSKATLTNLMLGTKYSLEKNITNQALLGYSITFDEFNQKINLKHSLEILYKLTDNLYISGDYGLENKDDYYQADKSVMVQHQIKFGASSKKHNK
ncbi:MAG: translocation/assembly module TamB [Endomicrobium sp.]|jgi:hypothetical protein|uniref:translocation/assembly module TamB domain-containing protein n=1 Tax=Candidatus Endomicrobiellum cubanum TaxID=3242325 RepID=UPI0028173C35|nr:translocation/assembly module TamB [Endomicrobium sp.]